MTKFSPALIGTAGLALAMAATAAPAPALAQGAVVGPDAAACRAGAGGSAVIVNVAGMKDRAGRVRVQLYSDNADSFLEKGAYLKRVDVPTAPSGPMRVCLPLPRSGPYAVYVLHDRAGDGKTSFSQDGFGFANNPKLRLAKPPVASVLRTYPAGVSEIEVVMNYRTGLMSVGPVTVRPSDR